MAPYNRSDSFRLHREGLRRDPPKWRREIGLLFAVALAVALVAQLGFGRGLG